jgi:hypothetical protein
LSVFDRKNPIGAVRAFREAFNSSKSMEEASRTDVDSELMIIKSSRIVSKFEKSRQSLLGK